MRGTLNRIVRKLARTGLATAALIGSGCAAQYTPSSAALETRAKLTPAAAQAILAHATQPNAEHKGGVTSVVVGYDELASIASDVKVTERGVAFVSTGKQLAKNEAPGPGCEVVPGSKDPRRTRCPYLLELAKVSKIRVVNEEGGVASVPGYDVVVQQSAMFMLTLNVPSSELDPLIAALTYYAPQAKLLSGAGF